ncbi:MAG: Nudix family hydrolase [Gammaproteobacteria bacterium]|nr:Nudix family hydrolase [Gammaproteobacteria bacterium]
MSEPASGDVMHVAAAALCAADGRILLTQRPQAAHQGGLWEFPGGKLEAGESVEHALRRELHEELGIDLVRHRPLIRITHHYPDRSVLLDVHRVDAWQGEPHGREGQPLAWALPQQLDDYPMPAADVPIVMALQLPVTYLITPPKLEDETRFLTALEASLAQGVRLVQLRLFDLPQARLRAIGTRVCDLCHASAARVLLNGDLDTLHAIGADGLHLSSRQLQQLEGRPLPAGQLLAASCHNPEDLRKAVAIDADFALLSPVLPTRSHPDAEPLGWVRFKDWVDAASLPVYALGGMSPELLEDAWRHGAQGIAGIRGLWSGSA